MKAPFSELARRVGWQSNDNTVIDTLLTDSRWLRRPESSLFFAIRTPGGNDGHLFIRSLYDHGVRHFVVNEIPESMRGLSDASYIIVSDTVRALQDISARSPESASSEVVAITGSLGKTTLKEWLFQLMEPQFEVSRSPRSFNSQIGVPLSMWGIEPNTEIAFIEAGVSRRGEMETLAKCIMPDTVIFTNIAGPHSEGFDGNNDKAREKALLASPDSVKTVIYNADSPDLKSALRPYLIVKDCIGWSVRGNEAELQVACEEFSSDSLSKIHYRFRGKENTFEAPVENRADLENAAAALAFMLHRGLDAGTIATRFKNVHKIDTRLQVAEGVNGCSVVHDSYTSDFSSLSPALNFMARRKMPSQSPTVILSDIHHETSAQNDIYRAIADEIKESGVTRFIGVGKNLAAHAYAFPENSRFFDTTDALTQNLSTSDFENEILLIKGAPEFHFEKISEMLEARKHETVLEVNLDAIVANYNYFRHHLPTGTGIVAMVKASGYGAGSREIAKTLQDAGAAYLAVAVIDEGIDLRNNGITMPIMVMNPKVVNYRSMFTHRLEPEVYSLEMLRDVIREGAKYGIKGYPIHLKLDTGMHRMGFIESELPEVIDILKAQDVVNPSSVFSHLATADCLDMDDYTHRQLDLYRRMSDFLLENWNGPIKRHVLNSAGILRFPQHHYNMARLGIGLYGANTLPPEVERPLAVVSTLRTVITSIREWDAGETIGYGRKGVLKRKSRIATIPIGYADGMNRHFGNGNISVKVNGHDAPTVGNICMDACMIDVTGIDCTVGDSVEIFGQQAPVQRLADLLDTIPYEILTSVSPRVKRVYYRE